MGELGADGIFTVSGDSANDKEHLFFPDFTSFLWVVQISLYCLERLLGGTDRDEQSLVAGLGLGGWVSSTAEASRL